MIFLTSSSWYVCRTFACIPLENHSGILLKFPQEFSYGFSQTNFQEFIQKHYSEIAFDPHRDSFRHFAQDSSVILTKESFWDDFSLKSVRNSTKDSFRNFTTIFHIFSRDSIKTPWEFFKNWSDFFQNISTNRLQNLLPTIHTQNLSKNTHFFSRFIQIMLHGFFSKFR